MSGRFGFIDHEWCPLPGDTVTLQQILSAFGVVTQMILDNPHLLDMGFNCSRGFSGFECAAIRSGRVKTSAAGRWGL